MSSGYIRGIDARSSLTTKNTKGTKGACWVWTMELISRDVDRIAAGVVDASLEVHSALGPGLLENVYEVCLAHELGLRGLGSARQVALPVAYNKIRVDSGLRLDLLVEEQVIVEVKAIDALGPIHTAQMITYLRLSSLRLGLLINFNVRKIKDGIKRVAL